MKSPPVSSLTCQTVWGAWPVLLLVPLVAVRAADGPREAGAAPRSEPRAVVSLRVSPNLWMPAERRAELLELLRQRRDTIEEVAFFTSFTHAVLPWETLEQRAELLKAVIPEFKKLGLRTGINHLCTIGHLDENLAHSLDEPWQKITDVNGTVARGCYCPLDPRFQDFTRRCYQALAEADPDFIWIDDDVRMGYHPPAVSSCFCDLCLARFGEETGEAWTRERAARVIYGKAPEFSREVRSQWAAHNRRIINEVFTLVRGAVDAVDPTLVLGFMPTDQLYETMDYPGWSRILAGSRQLPVKWRPGGGFYTDDRPLDALRKAHLMGRTAAAIPVGDTDIQQEHENFPYQKLKKSETVFMAETAMAMGAGCTGVALNVMGISPHPFDEYLPYFDRVRESKPFLDRLAAAVGRRPAEGVWPAFTADKTWAAGDADTLSCLTELAEIGLPPAYSRGNAKVHLLSGDAVHAFSRAELEALLSTAVLLDGPALQQLQALGLGDLVGFEIAGSRDRDTIERFTADPLNGSHADWWRDCRPSFGSTRAFILRATNPRSRSLAELIDFQEQSSGPVMGVSENRLGGRVAVLGYYPWTSLQNLSKSTQLKRVVRWLSQDTLPGYVASFHKLALWIRHTDDGRPTVVLVNISADAVENATLMLRTSAVGATLTDMRCREIPLPATERDGVYARFVLPRLAPWEAALVIGDKEN
jgi:hypothetical protein